MQHSVNYKLMTSHIALWLVVLLTLAGCGSRGQNSQTANNSSANSESNGEGYEHVYYKPRYAGGFDIVGHADSTSRIIRIKTLWQGKDSTAMELFIRRDGEQVPAGFKGQVIDEEARHLCLMSSSYVAMLDLLGETERIAALSGIDYISNTWVQSNHENITDIGPDSSADYERLIASGTDLVLLYGIASSSPMESRLRALGIPYLYLSEYLEPSPLGRAEWITAVAEIVASRPAGAMLFDKIESNYLSLQSLIPSDIDRPEVMLNLPYGDIWYMSPAHTGTAQMIEDAGAHYIWAGEANGNNAKPSEANGKKKTKEPISNKSTPIDFEEAYSLASKADNWLNLGQATSLEQILNKYPVFANLDCVKERRLYNNDARTTASGGNDFWETGQVRPDIVLCDLIRIFHPELLDEQVINNLEIVANLDSLYFKNLYYYRRF